MFPFFLATYLTVTLDNASDYRANGLVYYRTLSDGLTG